MVGNNIMSGGGVMRLSGVVLSAGSVSLTNNGSVVNGHGGVHSGDVVHRGDDIMDNSGVMDWGNMMDGNNMVDGNGVSLDARVLLLVERDSVVSGLLRSLANLGRVVLLLAEAVLDGVVNVRCTVLGVVWLVVEIVVVSALGVPRVVVV